jgi:alanine racemase
MTLPKPLHRRALDEPIRPTRVEIDISALLHNLGVVRALAPQVEVLAVVKANAYGHGAVATAQALEKAGVRFLGVALVEEGVELRNAGVKAPILVLGGSYEGGYDAIVSHGLTPTVFRAEHLHRLSEAASRQGRTVEAHLKVDTGMGRIGIQPGELDAFLETWRTVPNVRLEGLLSHFANADLADRSMTDAQVKQYLAVARALDAAGFTPRFRHLSNSAGVLTLPEVRDGLGLNLVRPGLMIYGLVPAPGIAGADRLKPVLTWKTAVIHVKEVPVGTPISYGGTWVAKRPSVIATLPVGYADGYSRRYSSRADVLVRGQRAKVAGRVCMDMCMVDVTDVPGVGVGDEVVLLGTQGEGAVWAEELAGLSDTISYEVLCGIGARVPRVVHS